MKIVHVVRQFLPSIGGLEDVVYRLVLEQQKNGHDVAVFTLRTDFQSDEMLPDTEVINGISIRRFSWSGSKRYPICPIDSSLLNNFDIVHVHAVDFFVEYISLLKRIGKINAKIILTTHMAVFFILINKPALKDCFLKQ